MERPHPSDPPRFDDQNRRLCRARRSDGELCNGPAITGGFVCMSHGGATKQARAKARERLFALVDPLLDELVRLGLEGKEERDRVAAIRTALDRVLPRQSRDEIAADGEGDTVLQIVMGPPVSCPHCGKVIEEEREGGEGVDS